MLNHFQFKLYRHDFQIKFSRCRLMMSHLLICLSAMHPENT